MNQSSGGYVRGHYEGILSAIGFGFFLILVGSLFIWTPNLFNDLNSFLSHFHTAQVGSTSMYIPAPENLGDAHALGVYLAAREFSLVWGVFLIAMLGARFLLDSPLRRKAQNVGDIVFWLGAAYLIQTFLVVPAQNLTIDVTKWFEFWASIVMFIGISLIVRAIFLVTSRARNI